MFARLPSSQQKTIVEAYAKLCAVAVSSDKGLQHARAVLSAQKTQRTTEVHTSPSKRAPGNFLFLPFSYLPHLCRCMNLCVSETELHLVRDQFGKSLQKLLSNGGGRPSDIPVDVIVFLEGDIASIYDLLAPLQPSYVQQYIQFFNLLDIHATGQITIADMRHVLCNLGDSLSEDEFHHLLLRHNLLKKDHVTLYEFLRLFMNVSFPPAPAGSKPEVPPEEQAAIL